MIIQLEAGAEAHDITFTGTWSGWGITAGVSLSGQSAVVTNIRFTTLTGLTGGGVRVNGSKCIVDNVCCYAPSPNPLVYIGGPGATVSNIQDGQPNV